MFYVPIMLQNKEFPTIADFCGSIAERPCVKARLWFFANGAPEDSNISDLSRAIKKLQKK